MADQLELFESLVPSKATKPVKKSQKQVVNVASVPQRSPFRYPGGKTWLIPEVRKWLRQDGVAVPLLIEPFVGGGIVSLTAGAEKLARRIIIVELDNEVCAVWKTIFSEDNAWLGDRIKQFDLTAENVNFELTRTDKLTRDVAFCTILKNRTFHGGIIAKGSGFLKSGENGKGILSRWYPDTLQNRISAIQPIIPIVDVIEGNAFDIIPQYQEDASAYYFIDPPYVGAGRRLYNCFELDHAKLFEEVSKIKGRYMLTYDDTEEVRELAKHYNLAFETIPMKTTHHLEKREIIVSDNFDWM